MNTDIVMKVHQDEIIGELALKADEARKRWYSLIGRSTDVHAANAAAQAWAEAVEIARGMGPRTERKASE